MKVPAFPALALTLLPALAALAPPAAADGVVRDESTLTITRSLHVPGAILPPGTYVVRLVDTGDGHDFVQIGDPDGTRVWSTTIATPDERSARPRRTEFVFQEVDGEPVALRSWWAPSDRFGQDFVYSKSEEAEIHADALRIAEARARSAAEAVAAKNEPTPANVAVAAVKPAPEPPALVAATPAKRLPQTASDTPLLFLVGILSLGSAATLRWTAARMS